MNKKELEKFISTYCDEEPQYLPNRDMTYAHILVNGVRTGIYVDDFMGIYSLKYDSGKVPPFGIYNKDDFEQYFLYHFQKDVKCLTYDEAVEKISELYETKTKPIVKAAFEEIANIYNRLIVDNYDFR